MKSSLEMDVLISNTVRPFGFMNWKTTTFTWEQAIRRSCKIRVFRLDEQPSLFKALQTTIMLGSNIWENCFYNTLFMGISPLYLWNVRNIITAGLTQVNCTQAFLSFCRFMLRKDWAFLWYVCTEYHVWKPILCWFHKSLVLWPRVSTSTLPTWSVVIWHSLRKSGAECSRGSSFISSDDMKFKALGERSSGRPFSLECSIERSTQADGTFWITPLMRDDTLPLVNCLSWGFLGSNWFFNDKLAP